jgi:hypothetical protein
VNNNDDEMWERRGRSGDLLFGKERDLEICMNGCAGNAA